MKIYILFVLAINTAMAFFAHMKYPKTAKGGAATLILALAFLLALVFQVYLCIFK